MRDPITGRDLSMMCWNGQHSREVVWTWSDGYTEKERLGCRDRKCGCFCHPRNQVAPDPEVMSREKEAVCPQ